MNMKLTLSFLVTRDKNTPIIRRVNLFFESAPMMQSEKTYRKYLSERPWDWQVVLSWVCEQELSIL